MVVLLFAALPAHGVDPADAGPSRNVQQGRATVHSAAEAGATPADDVLTPARSRRLALAAGPRPVAQSHPEVLVGEPYYGGVERPEIAVASHVTGEPLGWHLDAASATDRVTRAREQVDVALAVTGVAPSDDLAGDVDRAGAVLGLDVDTARSPAGVARLREHVAWALSPTLRVAGVDPGPTIDGHEVVGALRLVGHDPGDRVDAGDLRVLAAATSLKLAPLLFSAGHHPGDLVDDIDLGHAVRVVGHDPGSEVDAGDVAAALAQARGLHVGAPTAVSAGLELRRVVASVPGGPIVGHQLTWRLDDDRVTVRTEQTGDFTGRVSVPAMAAARPTTVAAVNGGFWLGAADPDGLLVTDGRLVSDPTMLRTWIRGRRGGFVIVEGGAAVGALDWTARIAGADPATGSIEVRGVNRAVGATDLVVYTDRFGPTTGTPSDTIEVTVAVSAPLTSSGVVSGRVLAVGANGDAPIPPGATVVAATGRHRDALLRMAASGTLHLEVEVPEPWVGARQGLTGGPLMLQQGTPTTTEEWRSEGFAPAHTDRRHPRTIVGFDAAGQGHVLVLDGRQPGYSVGATHAEATLLARSLGMVDAVMMDGGGSSQLVVNGALANRPCCDPAPRPVATAITFHATP